MINQHDRHICESNPFPPVKILYLNKSWNLDDGNDGYIEIIYCPYCGEKLPK